MATVVSGLDEQARVALLRIGAGGTTMGCLVGVGLVVASPDPALSALWGGVGAAGSMAAFALARGAPRASALLFFAVVLGVLTAVGAAGGNQYPATASLSLLVVMLAGLLVSRMAAIVASMTAVICAVALGIADAIGALPRPSFTAVDRTVAVVLSLIVGTIVFVVALGRLAAANQSAVQHGENMAAMAATLERAVDERTRSLVEARDAAEAASRAKSAFLANVSHELRTPLNAVVGILEVLRSRPRADDEADLIATMERSVDALLAVIDDTIDLARLEAGRLAVRPEPCSPSVVVQGVVDLLQGRARLNAVDLSVEIDADVPSAVLTDSRRLRQVLLNLVGNAIKFTRRGTVRIVIRRRDSARLVFDIVDTGVGIAAADQARLFQPFAQVDVSRARTHGGVGLGLAISRHLVGLLGGEIGVDSEPGRGSTFTFTIAAPATSLDEGLRAAGTTDAAAKTDALRCLIVEDNAVNRTVLELMMRRLGLEAESVEDGTAALARLAVGGVDVVLLDVQMPGVDGLEVTRRLVAGGAPRPWIIAVTAHALPDEERAARAVGVDDYLTKPVRLEALQRALARAPQTASSG
jgi:signal transduction histidine kinase/ActR/RegA family two-component response regulator